MLEIKIQGSPSSYTAITPAEYNVQQINSIKKKYEPLRSQSKGPTFALTYQGTHHTLMNDLGFTKEEAMNIEHNYHVLYAHSDAWVQGKLDEANKRGYVETAFGLKVRTPLLSAVIRGNKYEPYQAKKEGRTAGNALGQGYCMLTNRACNEFMERVWASPYRLDILPIAMIHDAIYFVFKDRMEIVQWVNKNLIECMSWQDLPELHHPTVKLGAELSIFHPSWADEYVLPNLATKNTIRDICRPEKIET
jgi:DNA polymerase-1